MVATFAYPVQDEMAMTMVYPATHHEHPAFDICCSEFDVLVFDDHLEVCVKEFENEVEVRFMRENVYQLFSALTMMTRQKLRFESRPDRCLPQ